MRLTFETLESRALVTADLFSSVPLATAATSGSTNSTPATATQSTTSNADPSPFVNISLQLTDSNDNLITGPLLVGETFWIDVLVDDTRSSLSDAGVDSAELNVDYDSTAMSPTGTITAGPDYPIPTGSRGSTSTAGSIQNVNGSVPVSTSGPSTPPGTGPKVLDRIQMTATGPSVAGGASITPVFASSGAASNSVFVGDVNGDNSGTAGAVAGSSIQLQGTSATILNPVTASLTGNSVTAGAAATSIQFTASLSGPVTEPITVHYTTQVNAGDTAVANTDFTSTTGTVQIAAGATSNTFSINIPADTTPQAAKTFHVAITSLDSATTGLVAISPTAGTASARSISCAADGFDWSLVPG